MKIISDRFKASENDLWFTSIDNRDFTYGEFWSHARSLAKKWKKAGLRKNDVVAFILPNDFSVLCCYLACAIGGFVACPVVDTLHESTIQELLDLVKPELVIDVLPRLEKATAQTSTDYRLGIDQDAPFLIMFTSGATGTPKAICHSFRSVVCSAQAFARLTGMTEKTRLYHILPMTYMAGFLNTMLAPLTVGASIVEGALFSPANAINFWERPLANGVNTLSIIPTVASALCRLTRNADTIADVRRQITQVQCTSASIQLALRHRFMEKFSLPLQDCYGITELGGPLTFQSVDDAAAFSEASIPLPEIDMELRNGAELWIRSPYSMLGYLENGKLVSPFDEKGFMNTGDLAEINDEKLHITGRVKDLVIRGGVNISSSKLESILSLMPEIKDVAIVGHEHEFWGEEIVACVIPAEEGWSDEERFFAYCAASLGSHERPDKVIFMDSFPRSFIGKLLKNTLRDTVNQSL